MEVATAQIAFHIEVDLDLTIALENDTTILKAIELGGTEPLLV